MIDIALCLDNLIPNAKYFGVAGYTEEEYNNIRWRDNRPKPSWSDVENEWNVISNILPEEDILTPINKSSRLFEYQIFKNGANSSGSFYTYTRVHTWNRESGSWNGWVNGYPQIIPFNCRIKKAFISFKGASFDWISTTGNIFLDIGFIDHTYNSAFNERIIRFELDGDFSGGNTGDNGFRFIVNYDKITNLSNYNYFNEGEIIGALLRSSIGVPGRIYQIRDAFHKIIFEEEEE